MRILGVRVGLGTMLVCVMGATLLVLSCGKDREEVGNRATHSEVGEQAKVGRPGVETQVARLEIGQQEQEGSGANKVQTEKTPHLLF